MKKYILDKQIRLKHDEASDKYYVFCIESGDHFELNKTGYLILDFLTDEQCLNDIVECIHKDKNAKIQYVRKDTIDFLKKSENNGIIVKI